MLSTVVTETVKSWLQLHASSFPSYPCHALMLSMSIKFLLPYISIYLPLLKRREHNCATFSLSGRLSQIQDLKQLNKYQWTHKLFLCILVHNLSASLRYKGSVFQGEKKHWHGIILLSEIEKDRGNKYNSRSWQIIFKGKDCSASDV